MASTKRPPSDPPGGRRRRPPTVIDLEATEVTPPSSESSPPPADDPAPQQQAEAPPQAKSEDLPPEQVAFEPPPQPEPAVEAKPQEKEREQRVAEDAPVPPPPPPPNNPPRPWLPVVAGLSGLGGGLVLFVLLWVSGALSTGQQASSLPQPSSPDLSPRLAAIEQQLKALAARPSPAASDPKALNDIAVRLGKLESAVSAPRAPVTDPVVLGRIAAAENAAKSIADNVASLEASLRDTNGQIQQLAATTAELQNRMRETGAGADRPVRLAVAASALRAAVERGEPYAAELAVVKPLAADTAAIGTLEPFAASGLPSPAALGEALAAIVRPMLNTPAQAPRNGTFLEKLQANAEKLVRIRPIDEARGDDRIAVLTRIEQRAAAGNIAGAQAELAKLPADIRAQAPLQAWTAKAFARSKAIEAAGKLAADAVTALKASP